MNDSGKTKSERNLFWGATWGVVLVIYTAAAVLIGGAWLG